MIAPHATVRPRDAFAPEAWHHDINPAIVEGGREFLLTKRQRSRRYPTRLLRYSSRSTGWAVRRPAGSGR